MSMNSSHSSTSAAVAFAPTSSSSYVPLARTLPSTSTSSSSGYTTPTTSYADDHSYSTLARPFKSPLWSSRVANRRNKNLKQVVALEKERVDRVIKQRSERWMNDEEAHKVERSEQLSGSSVHQTRLMDVESYMSVEAAPSILPQKKYCDVTGLEAKYVDPASTLRFHNPEVYEVIKTFQPGVIQVYLAVRGHGVVLR